MRLALLSDIHANLRALEACLDEAPFGCFIELEGSREDIEQALLDLGLEGVPPETRSYATLFLEAR